jgi:hypothetical protein
VNYQSLKSHKEYINAFFLREIDQSEKCTYVMLPITTHSGKGKIKEAKSVVSSA